MELVYLWIEEHKNIKDKGFNFSSKFDFEFKSDENRLILNNKKSQINIFPDDINYTTIVGKNGSGKSSIIELLLYFRTERLRHITNKKAFLIFENHNKLFILGPNTSFTHDFENYKNTFHQIINNTTLKIYDGKYISNNDDFFEFTYFSNSIFDINAKSYPYKNITSQHFEGLYRGLVHTEYNPIIDFNYKLLHILEKFPSFFQVIDHKAFDQIQFNFDLSFNNNDSSILDESEDEKLQKEKLNDIYNKCGINKYSLNYSNIRTGKKSWGLSKKYNLPIYQMFSDYFCTNMVRFIKSFNRELKTDIILNEFLDSINSLILDIDNQESFEKKVQFFLINNLTIIASIETWYKKFKNDINDTKNKELIRLFNHDRKYNNFLILLRHYLKILNILTKFFTVYDDTNKTKVSTESVTIESEKHFLYLKFIRKNSLLNQEFQGRLTLDFHYHENNNYTFQLLSSGEKAFIKYLVDFTYTILKDWKNSNRIFLNDEIELSFHPDWQKKINYYIIKLITILKEKNLSKNKKFHIINITHSPFMLSDIPYQNIIFLNRSKDGLCEIIDAFKDKKQTFASNIHLLLSDSFFMNNGLIGKFAEEWINEVINFLNTGQNTPNIHTLEKAQHIIDMIGEPIIQSQLQLMINDKYSDELKIKRLELELNKLREKV